MKTKDRLIEFDFIRIICTFWIVFFWHIKAYVNNEMLNTLGYSELSYQITYGVLCIFTLVSGFFNSNRVKNIRDIWLSIACRLLKLYPMYFVSCLSLYAIGWLDLKQLLISFTIIGGGVIKPYPSTIWYIAMIIVFNIGSIFIDTINTRKRWIVALVIELSIVMLASFSCLDRRYMFYFPVYVSGYFLKNFFHREAYERFYKMICPKMILLSTIVMIIYGYCCSFIGKDLSVISCLLSFLLFFSLLIMFSMGKKYMSNKVFKNAICKVGESTICLYLFHRYLFVKALEINGDELTLFKAYVVVMPLMILTCYFIYKIFSVLNERVFNLMTKLQNKIKKRC